MKKGFLLAAICFAAFGELKAQTNSITVSVDSLLKQKIRGDINKQLAPLQLFGYQNQLQPVKQPLPITANAFKSNMPVLATNIHVEKMPTLDLNRQDFKSMMPVKRIEVTGPGDKASKVMP